MPRIKRWFPVSREIFSDPQFGELIKIFGHQGFALWTAFLKMAEDDEGAILSHSYKSLSESMAYLARTDNDVAEKALKIFVKWKWVSQEWYESPRGSTSLVFRPYNYSKYHPKQEIRPIASFSFPPRPRRHNFSEGQQRTNQAGYIQIFTNGRWQLVHQMIAQKALGKKLPKGVQVHHFNLIKSDNRNANLVLCNDPSYHNLIHRRTYLLFEISPSGEFIRKPREDNGGIKSSPPTFLPSEPILKEPPLTPPNPTPTAGHSKNKLHPEIKAVADRIYHSDTVKFNRLVVWIKEAQKQYSDTVIAQTLTEFEPYARNLQNWYPYLSKIATRVHNTQAIDRTEKQSNFYKHENMEGIGSIIAAMAAKGG